MNSKKTTLLFITYTHSNGGGAENVLTTLVNNLESSKYEVTILEIQRFYIKKEPINNSIHLKSTSIIDSKNIFNLFNENNDFLLHNKPEILATIFNLINYDIVISWNYQLPSFLLNGITCEKKISWFHGSIEDLDIIKNPQNKEKYELQKKTWNNVKKIVTISDKSLQSLYDVFPEYKSKAQIIYNPTPIEVIKKKSLENIENNLCKNENILLSIGRLDSNKNYELPISAIKILKDRNIFCNYYIIGTGYLEDKLKTLIQKLELEDNVHLLGYIQNPYPYLKQAKLLCISSFSEGWGMTACEAMALGIPFITTPVAGASFELANDGKCGLVSGYTPEEYANKIQKLLESPVIYKQMSQNCIAHINNYSIKQSVEQFEILINNVSVNENFISKEKKQNNNATLEFIFLFSFSYANLLEEMRRIKHSKLRYKENRNIINLSKIIYHIIKILFNFLLIPVLFIPKLFLSIWYIKKAKK